jgi:thiosulfate/3-mercaptopyruvate sulfurtransferase
MHIRNNFVRIAMRQRLQHIAFLAVTLLVFSPALQAQFAAATQPLSAFTVPQAQLMQTEELRRILGNKGQDKPLVLHVGSHVLFAQSHITGSEFAGQGATAEGLQQLQDRVKSLPKKQFIVLYCGCCPWNHCPNVGAAFAKLKQLGFTNVKVLYMASNFGTDWASKGYPVEQGR